MSEKQRCEIVSSVVANPGSGGAFGFSVTRCQTHQWDFGQVPATSPCPLGRIEQATEEGLAKIEAATGVKRGWPFPDGHVVTQQELDSIVKPT